MRLWSLHPRYLDAAGLVAVWREGLLARKVLAGGTKGYTRHPQLTRFRECGDPLRAIDAYLSETAAEAERRGYGFDRTKIEIVTAPELLEVPAGQLEYEFGHLLRKLARRDPQKYEALKRIGIEAIEAHPLFRVVPGGVCAWETIKL